MRNLHLICFISLIICCTSACLSSDDDLPNGGIVTGNIHQPNGNQEVEQLHVGSEADRNSRIDISTPSGDGRFFFYGELQNNNQIGLISTDGSVEWSFVTTLGIRDLLAPSFTDNLLFAVGASDSDQDGTSDGGVFMIMESSGAVLSELLYEIPNQQLWFNSLNIWQEDNDSYEILVVGGMSDGTIAKPFIHQFSLPISSIGSTLEASLFDGYQSFSEIDNSFFLSTRREADGIYATLNQLENGIPIQFELVRISSDLSSLEWRRPVVGINGLNSDTRLGQTLAADAGHIYVIGNTDFGKEDGLWRAGMVAAIAKEEGNIVWKREISLSERADDFSSILIRNEQLYIAGTYSTYRVDLQNLGYGFMAKLNKSTGEREAFRSFGGDTFLSSFTNLHLKDDLLVGLGFTNLFSDDEYDNWILTFDRNTL
ncbi:MAG: hypothetical protein AAFP19_04375 [Bacteroidota bacterium]